MPGLQLPHSVLRNAADLPELADRAEQNDAFIAARFPIRPRADDQARVPYVYVKRAAVQGIPNTVFAAAHQAVVWDTEAADETVPEDGAGGMAAIGGGAPQNLTVRVPGVYAITATAAFAAAAGGARGGGIWINNAFWGAYDSKLSLGAGYGTQISCSMIGRFAAGDFFVYQLTQDSGGPLNIAGFAVAAAWLTAAWLGP